MFSLTLIALVPFAKGYSAGSDVVDGPSMLVQRHGGGFVLRAARYKSSTSEYDGAVLSLDGAGELLWARRYGWDTDHEYFYGIGYLTDGYVLAGYTQSWSGGYNVWVLKIDSAGNPVWSSVLGTSSTDMGYHVLPTSDGGLLVTGYTYAVGGGDALAIKLNSAGSVEWSVRWGGSGLDKAYAAVEMPDGYLITGFYDYSSSKVFVAKVRPDGSLAWFRTYDAGIPSKGYGIAVSGTDVYVSGQVGSYSSSDALLLRVDTGGTFVGARSYDFNGGEDLLYGLITYDGDVVASGTARYSSYDAVMLRVTPTGDVVWAKRIDYGWDEGYDVLPVLGGFAFGLGAGSYNSVAVTDTTGTALTCVSDAPPAVGSPTFSTSIPSDFTFSPISLTVNVGTLPDTATFTPYTADLCPLTSSEGGECSRITWEVGVGSITFRSSAPNRLEVYGADGRRVFVGEVKGTRTLHLKPGVYLWRGGRAVVR